MFDTNLMYLLCAMHGTFYGFLNVFFIVKWLCNYLYDIAAHQLIASIYDNTL